MNDLAATHILSSSSTGLNEMIYSRRFANLQRPLKILLIKPFQNISALLHSPPLGLLYLAAVLRERFGDRVEIELIDMKLKSRSPQWLADQLKGKLEADIVAISALNFEAQAAANLASLVKAHNPNMITVLGGPYALHRAREILNKSDFDWVFNGAADHTFPEIIARIRNGEALSDDIAGFSFKCSDGSLHVDIRQANIEDLDALPLPAWDMIDFDAYAKKTNMMGMLKGKRYATLFTSRGCPYKCNYCHDLFSKQFKYQSPENVIKEIEILYEHYGVDEFQIVDDIFNLHKPRLKQIMSEVHRRWPGKLKFNFPNGVRADILDDEVLDALRQAGTYAIKIAVETVTPRLQAMIEKDLDIEKTRWAIDACSKRGMMVGGFFMLGFPTETEEELQATIEFAIRSKLAVAHFFIVVPQKETPMYEQARLENAKALDDFTEEAESGVSTTYYSSQSWYQRAYDIPINRYLTLAFVRFYLSPVRIWRILTRVPPRSLFDSGLKLVSIVLRLKS
jgi:radical SAM superfamily enzyme YgiQ (UPF0313 family)